MKVVPLACVRPAPEVARDVAALPYDVFSREEAAAAVVGKPLSFLNIDRPETQFPPEQDMYAPEVYARARELLEARIADGTFVEDAAPCYYLYRLEMDDHAQTGFVSCCAIDDYLDGTIKRHENTRAEKELDRIRHIEALGAQTGPIFLAFRETAELRELARRACSDTPLYDFTAEDGMRHTVWRMAEPARVEAVRTAFAQVPCAYIADGHHRAASAVKVGLARREAARAAGQQLTGEEPFNFFLSVLFPAEELAILPYHRVVHDLGLDAEGRPRTPERLLADLRAAGFTIQPSSEPVQPGKDATHRASSDAPSHAGRAIFGMYLAGSWWHVLAPQPSPAEAADPVARLDASVLQNYLLGPVLGISDPRTDARVEFVGGIRGLPELERRVIETGGVAFSLRPTTLDELLAVADAGLLMPPKSTWFEPKLRSGLFIHRI